MSVQDMIDLVEHLRDKYGIPCPVTYDRDEDILG